MPNIDFDTVSGNTPEILPETPETGEGGVYDEENQESGGDGSPSGSNSESSGSDSEAVGSEDTDVVPSGGQSGSSSEDVGGQDSMFESGISPDYFKEVLDGIATVSDKLDGSLDYEDVLESLHNLTDIIALQIETYSSNPIPISGYQDYDYPITVTWEVSPSAINTSMQESRMYYTSEEFEKGYQGMCDLVGVTLKSFRILRISDCSDLDYVYDVDNLPETPEEEETESTFQDDILVALSGLHDDMQIIIENDTAYREQYFELQEQYAEAQKLNTDLQYHLLATNIAIGFTLLLTLGYTVAHGFLQRMKVG